MQLARTELASLTQVMAEPTVAMLMVEHLMVEPIVVM
jgi:hypothetical protein